ncbi:hypothetical protein F2Q68_00017128 [Brassica cretica]|uniref:Uncharacterized protein n=1 Tax=Brassica cretica TaxID=69181 RepID=A0A8S9HK71_BRACR|nr:hypothetical protein F2Q68_00017128 [Brassica cretica]
MFLILAQTISACSTSASKQDDLTQLADSLRTARDSISTLDSSCSRSQQSDSSRQHHPAFRSVPARGSSLWWSIQPYLRLR